MRINKINNQYFDSGMTLVELLVVLAVIGTILSLALPSIKSLGSGLILHMEAIQLAQDMRYTQQLSLTHNENHMLQLDKQEDFYFIKPVHRHKAPRVKTVELNKNIHIGVCTFQKYSSGSYRHYIEFNSVTGIPGQTGTVELMDDYGNRREVVVEVASGQVKIK